MQQFDWRGFDWQRLLVIELCAIAAAVLFAISIIALAAISHAVILFGMALILALAVAPAVNWGIDRGCPRVISVAAVYAGGAGIVLGVALLIALRLGSQNAALVAGLPGYVGGFSARLGSLEERLAGTPFAPALESARQQTARLLSQGGNDALRTVFGGLQAVGGGFGDSAIVLTVSVMMLLGAPSIRRAVLGTLPRSSHTTFYFLEANLQRVVGGYVRSQLVIAVISAAGVALSTQLLGLPYALLLGMLAGILGLIPMAGPVLAVVPALLVALGQPFPTIVWVAVVLAAVEGVLWEVIAPRIQGGAVGLHPLAAIFAVLAGLQLGGLLGALVALPVAGLLWAACVAVYKALAPAANPEPD